MTYSGLPSARPIEAAMRSCRSDSFGSFAFVEVSCLEMMDTSSGVTPCSRSATARREFTPPRAAESAPRPGAGMEVCAPSAKDSANATTPRTGRPCSAAKEPRASSRVPPPSDSMKPPRRRSFAREKYLWSMPLASISAESAVAAMSPKPVMPSMERSSIPPATTKSALPRRSLSMASSTETAAVAHAATGWIIWP